MHTKEWKSVSSRLVFPADLNDQGFLFGGRILEWMDEAAYITATRFTRQRMVTCKVDDVEFLSPVPLHTIVNINTRIARVTASQLFVDVEAVAEDMVNGSMKTAVRGVFHFAGTDADNKPVRIRSLSKERDSSDFLQRK